MLNFNFDNTYAAELTPHGLAISCEPEKASDPKLAYFNQPLAQELQLLKEQDASTAPAIAEHLSGNDKPPGAMPIAQAYAGHQFGQFNPQLGDGRALILGEHLSQQGARFDICLKGSGRTPYSRGGDGKAGIAPMLREVLIAEAMHALGIPSTRSLAVVTTGDLVFRNQASHGAVLTRIAASHIRIGTFEFLAARQQFDALQALADYTIARHFPEIVNDQQRYQKLLGKVIDRQAETIAQWMGVGFIHGVMNTDNMLISGETIDYGPCAFMDSYDPKTVFSSIDHGSRYAYGNQPNIALWNLTRFAETLLPLIQQESAISQDAAIDIARAELATFEKNHADKRLLVFFEKLGLAVDDSREHKTDRKNDEALVEQWLSLLQEHRVDFTNGFRSLADCIEQTPKHYSTAFLDTPSATQWLSDWRARLERSGHTHDSIRSSMLQRNPAVIPRNQLVEIALEAAEQRADLSLFESLLEEITDPFRSREPDDPLTLPGSAGFYNSFQTFCGT